MTTPRQLAITMPEDCDSQITTMAMLAEVMRHMTEYESLRDVERHEIAEWFRSRFGKDRTLPPTPPIAKQRALPMTKILVKKHL